ncbi:MAG: hypothetical protein M1827_005034 [Pycnora praestabilis]|nr:MAG: hypothetical protein M1827_005034 [Pycnora praestabilis]
MFLLRRIAAFVTGACLIFRSANDEAHSQSRNALNYLSLVESPEILLPSHRVNAFSTFDLRFSLHQNQQQVKLSLEPNHDILSGDATVEYLDAEGKVAHTEVIDRHAHKVFKGYAWLEDGDGNWSNVGWARIVIRRDGKYPLFEGAFTIMHDHHHIQLRSNYEQTKHELDPYVEDLDDEVMVIFRNSDISFDLRTELKRSAGEDLHCPSDRLSFNVQPDHPIYSRMLKREKGFWGSMAANSLLTKRQIDGSGPSGGNSAGVNLTSTIGQSSGCPSTRKVALVGVATDCGYTGSFNSTESARQNVITQINSASDLYEKSFNITLGLQVLTVNPANCPGSPQAAAPWNIACSSNNGTIQDRLNTFSEWRGTRNDSNAYWTLLTSCNTGAAVGLAWLGQACVQNVQTGQNESVSGANVVARTSTEWQVIA